MHFRDGFCGDKGSIIDAVSHRNVSCEDRIPTKVAKWKQISQNRFIYWCITHPRGQLAGMPALGKQVPEIQLISIFMLWSEQTYCSHRMAEYLLELPFPHLLQIAGTLLPTFATGVNPHRRCSVYWRRFNAVSQWRRTWQRDADCSSRRLRKRMK